MNRGAVKFSTDDFVLHTNKVLASPPAHQHHVVLLEVVPLARHVGNNLTTVAKTHFDALAVCAIGLFGLANEGF